MSEDRITEKVYCYDHPSAYNNHDALAIAAMCNKQHQTDPMAMMAAMNGGMGNGMWNNPFIYLVWMMFAGRMFGNGWGNDFNGQGAQNVEMQNQLQAIRSQMQDNQNSNLIMDAVKGNNVAIGQLAQSLNCDFNALQGAICDVRGGIDRVSGQIGSSSERIINAVNMGDCNVIQALKDCCCATQRQIADFRADVQLQMCQQTGELRNGQRDLGVAIAQGFSQTAYETQRQTCDIINAGNANTQRIIDTLNNHWNDENQRKIQDLKFELSQERQNNLLLNRFGRNCGCNDNCGCGCGCGQ